MEPDFEARVRDVIGSLEPGQVMSYGEVATEAGYPGAARAVGNLLRTSTGLPWWRIVASDGRLVPGGEHEQRERLAGEGVGFTPAGKVSRSHLALKRGRE